MAIRTKFVLRPDARPSFWDRSKHHHYLVALLIAEMLQTDKAPSLISTLNARLENWSGDPSMAYALRLWRPLVSRGATAIAQALIATTPAGEALRDTTPPIVAFRPAVMRDIIAQRRHEIAVGKAVYASSPCDK